MTRQWTTRLLHDKALFIGVVLLFHASWEMSMAVFDEESAPGSLSRRSPPLHEVGQVIDALSIAEIDDRIASLRAEIDRLVAAKSVKEATKRAADAFFKS
jgi:uncharacterized small protein (DUF1192 family)